MFSNILIGIDHRDGGHDAVALAKLWFADGAQLTLAHVYTGEPYVYPAANAEYAASERELGLVRLEEARYEAALEAQLRWLRAPTVGRGLHELCEELAADLLVIGTSRHKGVERALAGDDARESVRRAPCAVAIAPAGYGQEQHPMREIGVGYDTSPESRNALRVGRDLAAEHRTKLSAMEAVYVSGTAWAYDQEWIDAMVRVARDRIDRLGHVEAHASWGRPAKELARYSGSLDLLVIGSTSNGSSGRPKHRSTTQRLEREVRCPLLIIPTETPPPAS